MIEYHLSNEKSKKQTNFGQVQRFFYAGKVYQTKKSRYIKFKLRARWHLFLDSLCIWASWFCCFWANENHVYSSRRARHKCIGYQPLLGALSMSPTHGSGKNAFFWNIFQSWSQMITTKHYAIFILRGLQLFLALLDKIIQRPKISACLRALPLSLKTFLVSTRIMVSCQELFSQIGSE